MSDKSLNDKILSKKKILVNAENNVGKLAFNKDTASSSHNSTVFNDSEKGLDRGVVYIEVSKLKFSPKEWDPLPPLSEPEYNELKANIYERGMHSPILVYEISKDEYMVLAGKNRTNIYRDLIKIDPYKYRTIPAIIETSNSVSELDMRDSVLDLNLLGRQLSKLQISKVLRHKWIISKERAKQGDGNIKNNIGEILNLSGKQIYRYMKLLDLIPEFQDMVEQNLLSVDSGSKIALLDNALQLWLYENHRDKLQLHLLKSIRTGMNLKELKEIFLDTKIQTNKYKFEVPSSLKEEFENYIKVFFEEHKLI